MTVDLSSLNDLQQRAVKSTDGPVLILAGAGSGKTRVLTYKAAYLISNGVSPEGILCLTFTNKAANEMKTRILNLINQQPATYNPLPTMGTFHSVCAKILRQDGHLIGLPPSFTIYDENDSIDAVKQAMAALDISTQKNSPFAIRQTISGAKNEMIGSLEYPRFARGFYQEQVAKIYLEYQKILEKNKAVDFDDLLLLVVKIFQNYPATLASYQIRFHYILVDEYQDTNPVQYLLTKMLASRYRNICVVGDASQSIYMFRGADFRNIVNFKNDYPQAKVFNLEQNYRSTQNILDAAYSVISKNTTHPILKLWTDNPRGEKINVTEAKNEEEEAEFVVQKVTELGLPLSHFAVLYRTNAQSRILEEIFLKHHLPYILIGGIRFYERKEIKDILAYLRLILNPADTVSKSRIEKIGKTRAAHFWEIVSEIGTSPSDYSTLELLDKVVEKTNYLEYIDDGTELGKARVENVKEIRSVAEQTPQLAQFLENVALVESEYSSDEKLKKSTKDAVTLTTLHQAKGLEWPVVFIVGMEEGLFPHSRCLLDPAQMEEERRLCYVGLTRAKNLLFLTRTRQRLYFGTRSNNLISRFLIDIPEDLIESNSQIAGPPGEQFLDNISISADEDDWLDA